MRKAIVTGASRGIGAACARALYREGWHVTVNYYRSAGEAEALAEEIGGTAFRADVADRAQVRAMFDACGAPELLVCCAGVSGYGLFGDMSDGEWDRLFAVNVDGARSCILEALPRMIHEKRGNIITVSSVWGLRGASCEAAYSASKAALIGLTKALAKELGPSGIRVNCIAPGVIATDMLSRFSREELAALEEETPLGRLGGPEEVAELAAFLASERAGFITGQVIGVDGGFGV